jgi:hypothetical protein
LFYIALRETLLFAQGSQPCPNECGSPHSVSSSATVGPRRAHNLSWHNYTTTSARCLYLNFLAGFLGLGRPTALVVLPLRLQLLEVLGTSLGDLPPAFPSKTDGGGILLVCQNTVTFVLAADCIMHDARCFTNPNPTSPFIPFVLYEPARAESLTANSLLR